MATEQCLVLIKPDAVLKSLTGNIISALSETKLKIVGAKVVKASREQLAEHYVELKERKPLIYEETLNYMTGKYHADRIFALVYQGEEATKKIREIAGETNPEKAQATSIRGKFGRIHSETKVFENVLHASDSPENAEKEIKLWFSPSELAEVIYPIEEKEVQVRRTFWK